MKGSWLHEEIPNYITINLEEYFNTFADSWIDTNLSCKNLVNRFLAHSRDKHI